MTDLSFDPAGVALPLGHYIDGARGETAEDAIPVRRPSDSAVYGAVPDGSADTVDRAVSAAARAFARSDWATRPPRDRARVLRRWAELVDADAPALARLEAVGSTRPIKDVLAWDVPFTADLAIAGAMASKFRNAGQTCVCANRILVQDGIHDRFVAALSAAVSALRVGDGREPGVTLGPLINVVGRDKVLAHLDDARSKGAEVALGGGGSQGGSFVEPTVLTGATPGMRLAGEETFGPLAPVFRFRHEEEALLLANDTPFGLAAYFYTDDLRRSWRVAERLEAGMVGLNTGSVSMEMAPFGGIKQSGIGREGSSSGIEEYLEVKSFHIGGLD